MTYIQFVVGQTSRLDIHFVRSETLNFELTCCECLPSILCWLQEARTTWETNIFVSIFIKMFYWNSDLIFEWFGDDDIRIIQWWRWFGVITCLLLLSWRFLKCLFLTTTYLSMELHTLCSLSIPWRISLKYKQRVIKVMSISTTP